MVDILFEVCEGFPFAQSVIDKIKQHQKNAQDIDLPKGMTLEDDEPSGDDGPPEWKGWRDEQQRRLQKKGRGLGRYEVGYGSG